jgi:hypothetical protein
LPWSFTSIDAKSRTSFRLAFFSASLLTSISKRFDLPTVVAKSMSLSSRIAADSVRFFSPLFGSSAEAATAMPKVRAHIEASWRVFLLGPAWLVGS